MELKDCETDDFLGSHDEKTYFKSEVQGEGSTILCLTKQAKDLMIEGNIQSAKTYRKRNSFLSI